MLNLADFLMLLFKLLVKVTNSATRMGSTNVSMHIAVRAKFHFNIHRNMNMHRGTGGGCNACVDIHIGTSTNIDSP